MLAPEILSALTTPFADDGEVDLPALEANLSRLEPMVDGVFMAGTTGEFLALTPGEHAELVERTISAFGPDRVVVHVGSASTRQSLELTREAVRLGARRFAALTPFYLPASPEATARHWGAIKEACGGELYGYIYPDVAVTDLLPDALPTALASGIDGIKISATASSRVEAYLAAAPPGFKLWSGNDADVPHVMAVGGTGTVSGCSGVHPQPWVDLREALRAGDDDAAAAAQARIEQIVPLIGPSIANLKHGLDAQGLTGGACRMPIDPPTDDLRRRISAALTTPSA
ncbi:MAG: dihydrodipicolinate synthase family protein [Propionibacteriaceae bacterium]|nr:dihydrodipicolinate synthase family protein [Propionibacteriaceae bacterium]